MQKFIISLLIFALPVIIAAVCLEVLVRHIPNDYLYKKNYLDKHSKQIQILFLGSSHAFYGINPQYIKANSFNAAYVSQTPEYDLAILKKYNHKWDSLKYIVIPIDYFSLTSNLQNSEESWRVKNYKIYYGISLNYSISDNFEIFNTRLDVNIGRALAYYRKKIYALTCSNLGWGTNYKSEKAKDLISTGILAAQRHTAVNNQYFKQGVENLDSIIKFAQNNSIKIIIYTSPAYKSYIQNLSAAQLQQTINAIHSAASANNNVTYFNLLTDTSFVAKDFFDADHLNELGAQKLTLKLDSLIHTVK